MLKLKSSARIKKRYLLLSNKDEVEIKKVILDYIGILGWAKASPVFIKNKKFNLILAIDRKELDNVRAAFEVSDKNIKILRVCGTIKGLSK